LIAIYNIEYKSLSDKWINIIPVCFLQALPPAVKELQELREFYDPDTVELMEWIELVLM